MDTGVTAIPGTDFCDEGYYESWKCGNLMDSDNHCAFAGQEDEKRRLYVGTGINWFVNCRQYFT